MCCAAVLVALPGKVYRISPQECKPIKSFQSYHVTTVISRGITTHLANNAAFQLQTAL